MKKVIEGMLNNDTIRKMFGHDFLGKIYSNEMVKKLSNSTILKYVFNKKVIGLWYLVFLILIIVIYILNVKSHKSQFKEVVKKDYPSSLRPTELAMLMYKKMIPEVITATILVLIKNNKILIEEEEDDYLLVLNDNVNYKVRTEQQCVIDILFNLIARGNKVKLSEIERYASKKGNSSDFFTNYYVWKRVAQKETFYRNFFEPKSGYKLIIFYKYITLFLVIINFLTNNHWLSAYLLILLSIALNLFFYKSYKRTKEANDEFYKWKGFKTYLLNYKDKDNKLNDEQSYFFLIYGTVLKVSNLFAKETFIDKGQLVQKLNKAINKCVINAELYAHREIKWR